MRSVDKTPSPSFFQTLTDQPIGRSAGVQDHGTAFAECICTWLNWQGPSPLFLPITQTRYRPGRIRLQVRTEAIWTPWCYVWPPGQHPIPMLLTLYLRALELLPEVLWSSRCISPAALTTPQVPVQRNQDKVTVANPAIGCQATSSPRSHRHLRGFSVIGDRKPAVWKPIRTACCESPGEQCHRVQIGGCRVEEQGSRRRNEALSTEVSKLIVTYGHYYHQQVEWAIQTPLRVRLVLVPG